MKAVTGDKISTFEKLLSSIKTEDISNNPYCRNYLSHLLEHKQYYLRIYSEVLRKTLNYSPKPKEEILLVDMGAGNGLLGIFASYCGFGKVYINDSDPVFLNAASALAQKLNVKIEHFIPGDLSDPGPLKSMGTPDAIIGTDVIEHVYDLGKLFQTFAEVNPDMVTVFTTAANPCNFFKIKKIRRLQRKDEKEGNQAEDGSASHPPYSQMRRTIIESLGKLSENELQVLTSRTRGYKKEDILKALEKYTINMELPIAISDPYNTCHPLTGSWTERVLSIDQYRKEFGRGGFSIEIFPGFYDEFTGGGKKTINKFLNKFIFIFGCYLAPFIFMAGYTTKGKRG